MVNYVGKFISTVRAITRNGYAIPCTLIGSHKTKTLPILDCERTKTERNGDRKKSMSAATSHNKLQQ